MSDWKKAGQAGKMIRWNEQPENDKQAESTIYIGTVVEGTYVAQKTNVGANESNIYEVETKDHGKVSIWGTFVLDDKMSEVPVGSMVQITYLGKQTPKSGKGKPYSTFEVLYAEPKPEFKKAGDDLPTV